MASSGMLGRVALVRTDVSDERRASIIRVIRIGGPETLAVTSNRRTLPRHTKYLSKFLSYSETSVLARDTRCNIPEDAILQLLDMFLSVLSLSCRRKVGTYFSRIYCITFNHIGLNYNNAVKF
jgi:hypothetical protein